MIVRRTNLPRTAPVTRDDRARRGVEPPPLPASVRALVDEMVVVDTGSTDATREVAAAAGARVHEIPWQDDFAAARNASLDLCRGRWILVLDADEVIAPASRGPLRAWVRAHDAAGARAALSVDTRNYQPEGVWRRGWQRVPDLDPHGLPGGPPSLGFVTSRKVRLFPRRRRIRFRGCLHETVEASLARGGVAGPDHRHPHPPPRLVAPGSRQATALPPARRPQGARGAGRRRRLGRTGRGLSPRRRPRAALEAIDQAVRLSCGRPDYALTAGLLWLEAGAAAAPRRCCNWRRGRPGSRARSAPRPCTRLARAALHRGQLQQAGDLLDAALRLAPQDGQIWNSLGVLAVRGRRGERCRGRPPAGRRIASGRRLPLAESGHPLRRGPPARARLRYLRLALARDPACAEARRRLERLSHRSLTSGIPPANMRESR